MTEPPSAIDPSACCQILAELYHSDPLPEQYREEVETAFGIEDAAT